MAGRAVDPGTRRARPPRRAAGASRRLAARRGSVRSRLGERCGARWTGGQSLQSCPCGDRARRRVHPRTARCSLSRAGDRRRPRAATRHDRTIPGERVVAFDGCFRTKCRVRPGCLWAAAGAAEAVAAMGDDGVGDCMVRGDHPLRAVDPAGGGDGGLVGDGVHDGAGAISGADPGARRHRAAPRRPVAVVVGRVLVVGRCHRRRVHGGPVARRALRAARSDRPPARDHPRRPGGCGRAEPAGVRPSPVAERDCQPPGGSGGRHRDAVRAPGRAPRRRGADCSARW